MSNRKLTKNTRETADSGKTIISVQIENELLAELKKRKGREPLSYAVRDILRKGLLAA